MEILFLCLVPLPMMIPVALTIAAFLPKRKNFFPKIFIVCLVNTLVLTGWMVFWAELYSYRNWSSIQIDEVLSSFTFVLPFGVIGGICMFGGAWLLADKERVGFDIEGSFLLLFGFSLTTILALLFWLSEFINDIG